jgi:hypothetical protein
MKAFSAILILLSISAAVYGEYDSAISDLNADLVPIYEQLMAEGRPMDLVGRRLDLSLNLKYSSDRLLLFTDTQIAIDRDTKYYLIKWKFKPNDIKPLLGKSNVGCNVKGRIVEVIKGKMSPGMPYIVVELESIEF